MDPNPNPNPWLSIPLADYEGHMEAATQLRALSELFARALELCQPESVAILGIAGGNGLEHIDPVAVTRVVGIDINPRYLDEVRHRFDTHPNLELHCIDLSQGDAQIAPLALVHAALFFEHAGLDRALDNALSLVSRGGKLSVVLQLAATHQPNVTPTSYASMQTLTGNFSLVDTSHFRDLLATRGFKLLTDEFRPLPTGKALWLGVFAAS